MLGVGVVVVVFDVDVDVDGRSHIKGFGLPNSDDTKLSGYSGTFLSSLASVSLDE